MKILHIVNEGLAGGVLRVALECSKCLNRLNNQSFVLMLLKVNIPRNFVEYGSRPYYLFKSFPLQIMQDYLNPLLKELIGYSIREIPFFIKKVKPDWLLLHNLSAFPLALRIKQIIGSNIAVYIHNPTNPPSIESLIHRLSGIGRSYTKSISSALSNMDLILTSSNKMRTFIRKRYGFDSYVIAPGCNPCSSEELVKRKSKIILIPQRLSLGKDLIKIAEILRNHSIPIVFAGSVHYTTNLVLKKLSKIGLKKYFVLANIDEFVLKLLYRRSLFIFSVVKEPFGLHIMEAASQGTTMVVPKEAGATELFQHNIHGLFFTKIDEALKYIDMLLNDEKRALLMGINAWKICKEKYTWIQHAKKLLSMLETY